MIEQNAAFEIALVSVWSVVGDTVETMEWTRDRLHGIKLMAITLGNAEAEENAELLRGILHIWQEEKRGLQ